MKTNRPDALASAISLYFDVLYTCDLEKFDAVFAPSAQLQTAVGGTLSVLALAGYRELLANRVAPAKTGARRDDQILDVDMNTESCALVKVTALVGEKRFVDYLSFLKIDGRWKIVAKVYMQTA